MKKYTIVFLLLGYSSGLYSQSANNGNIPLSRLYFHETIDATRSKIFKADKTDDQLFNPTANQSLNHELTTALVQGVDGIKTIIEKDSLLDNNKKIKFLRGLNETLNGYLNGFKYDSVRYSVLPDLLSAFKECMRVENNNKSIEPQIASYDYETGNILIRTVSFSQNKGIEKCKEIVLLKYCDKYKQKALTVLSQHPELSFTDSLVTVIAYRDPENLYTYAGAANQLATKIQQNPDPLVKVISRMSQMKAGRQLFPFLDNIY